jgi:hypothetical protein
MEIVSSRKKRKEANFKPFFSIFSVLVLKNEEAFWKALVFLYKLEKKIIRFDAMLWAQKAFENAKIGQL